MRLVSLNMPSGTTANRRHPLYGYLVPVILLLTLSGWASTYAKELPEGLIFSGFYEGQWQLYRSTGRPDVIDVVPTTSEARTPAISPDGRLIAFIAADGSLREIQLEKGSERVLLPADEERGLTHPTYDGHGRVIAVWLMDGSSVDTDLVMVRKDGHVEGLLAQRSAQFEPALGPEGSIYYSNVLCTVACGEVIQEIWRYDSVSGRAEQITLLNGISRQPHVAVDRAIYFSSNANGYYHIWRYSPNEGRAWPITSGPVVDAWPVVTKVGTIFFVRHSSSGAQLMRLDPGMGEAEPVDLPIQFKNLKDLGLAPCASGC